MTKVLVPFDFSEQAQNALDFTTLLTSKFENVEVIVLHVIEVPNSSGMGTMGGGDIMPEMENQIFFIELMDRRKQQFKELESKYAGNSYKLSTKIVMGNAFKKHL